MANKFETATNNYGNNFSNNNGDHYYTTNGHNYNDSDYVLAKFNGQVDPLSITSTLNGYPSNTATAYGQSQDVSVKNHSHVDDYTQTITLGWPNNINTKGKIEGTLTFSVDKTTVPGGGVYSDRIVHIHFPDLKYTATRDTRGYRYVNVTLNPDVPSNPDDLDDDGTEASNATILSSTYVGKNRQGFLNYREPVLDYVIYSSYVNKVDNPFKLIEKSNIYNGTGALSSVPQYQSSTSNIFNRYMHIYDNINTIYSYGYAPYDDKGGGWAYADASLFIDDNCLSTFPKVLTISYDTSTYWKISYDGTDDLEVMAAFVYNGTYGGVTSSTSIDTNLTSYERKTVLYDGFHSKIENSSTTPTYLGTSYTITQEPTTIEVSYIWTSPQFGWVNNVDGKEKVYITNLDDNGKLYVKFSDERNPSTKVIVSAQNHHMGSVSGDLDFSFAKEATNRKVYVDQGTVTYGTFGDLAWEDCENGEDRYFNVRISTEFYNCRNQNITSITNEYEDDTTKQLPAATIKCKQLPANWSHPAIRTNIILNRAYIPDEDEDRFRNVNPTIFVKTDIELYTIDYNFSLNYSNVYWSTSTHCWRDISTISDDNSKLQAWIEMPSVASPYVKSTIKGTIEYRNITLSNEASVAYIRPTAYPGTSLSYTLGYEKGYGEARWSVHSYSVEGYPYSDDLNDITDPIGMSYENVEQFEDFEIVLPEKGNYNYRYPALTISGTLSDTTYFSLVKSSATLEGSEWTNKDSYSNLSLQVSVQENKKVGSYWYAEVITEPTSTVNGIISLSPCTLRNKAARSAQISFSDYVNSTLTDSGVTLKNKTITCLQQGDKWNNDDYFIANIDILHYPSFEKRALLNSEVRGEQISMKLIVNTDDEAKNATYNYVPEQYSIGHLVEAHQLLVTGIGTIASNNRNISANVASIALSYSGKPAIESVDDFSYQTDVTIYCDKYQDYGVTKGPNNYTKPLTLNYYVDPIPAKWHLMYRTSTALLPIDWGAWTTDRIVRIGKNQGETIESSCKVMDGVDLSKSYTGVFKYTPERFTGARERSMLFQLGVRNDNDDITTFVEESKYYTITQAGVAASVTSHEYTFKTNGTRCTTSTPDPVSGTETLSYVGAFDVTPDADPFKNYVSYTNGMVSGTFDTSNYKEGLTKDGYLSPTHTTYDVPSGTNINFRFGLSGSSNDYITWSRSGYIKYKFYYNYCICALDEDGAIVAEELKSKDFISDTVTSYPDANAINYYKRRLDNGSWSSTLTIPITSTGDYSITGSFVNGSTEYSTSKRRTYSLTVRTYTDSQEYQYQIPVGTGKMSLSFKDSNGNTITSPVVLPTGSATTYIVKVGYPEVYLQLRGRTKRTYNTGETEYVTGWTSWSTTNILAFSLSPTPPQYTFNVSSGKSESYSFYLTPLTQYRGWEVITNSATGDHVEFTVRMKGSNYDQYSVTSITLTSSTPYTTYNKSLTVTPTFTYVIAKKTYDGDGNLISTVNNYTDYCPYRPSLNETSHTFSNMTFYKTYIFTFTVSLPSGLLNATGASLPTHTVNVTRLSNDSNEYKATSISLSSDTPYTTYNASFTVTPRFTYTIQKRVLDGDGNVKNDWSTYNYPNGVRLNETSHTFTNLVVNVPQEFTFTTSTASDVTNATGASLPTHTVKVTRIPDTIYRTVYKYTSSVSVTMTNQTLTAFDTDKKQTANATWTCTYWKRTDSRSSSSSTYTNGSWQQIDNKNNYGSINSTTYTFTNVPLGLSASTYGVASYTFTVTPPNNPSGLNDGTFNVTVYAYMYGKTYYNS